MYFEFRFTSRGYFFIAIEKEQKNIVPNSVAHNGVSDKTTRKLQRNEHRLYIVHSIVDMHIYKHIMCIRAHGQYSN